jgi:sortase B
MGIFNGGKKKINRIYMGRRGMAICLVLLLGTLTYICVYYARQIEAEQQYRELQEIASQVPEVREVETEEEAEQPEEASEDPVDLSLRKENTIDFETLWETNEDIYAWIEVPGTLVNYPVLQHPEDDSYYLNHTVEGVSGLPGSIYSESVHPKDFSAVNTVLYGHNMKNDTMFGSLHEYEDQEFFQEHPYIYIYLPNRSMIYRIFASSRFSDAYLPTYCDYGNEEDFLSYVDEIRACAICQDADAEVPYGSRLLTLSTCIGDDSAHRFLVEAVLIDAYTN